MSPYVEQMLKAHFHSWKEQSPFVQLGLSEQDVRSLIGIFMAIVRNQSKKKYFLRDEDAFSNVSVALGALWVSKRDNKAVKADFYLHEFMEHAIFDHANEGLAYLPRLFRLFFIHFQERVLYGPNAPVPNARGTADDNPPSPDENVRDASPGPEDLADVYRIEIVWHDCLQRLPNQMQMIIGMILEQLKQKDIAQALGMTDVQVSLAKTAAARMLQSCLMDKGVDHESMEMLMEHRILHAGRKP